MKKEKSLKQLLEGMSMLPQTLINLKTEQAIALSENPDVRKEVSEVEKSMADNGRVLLRPSGTEPLLRIMVEGVDEQLVVKYAKQLADRISAIEKNLVFKPKAKEQAL